MITLTDIKRAEGNIVVAVSSGNHAQGVSLASTMLGIPSIIVMPEDSSNIHPFDDPLVIAGQGTIGLELLEDLDGIGVVVVPVPSIHHYKQVCR